MINPFGVTQGRVSNRRAPGRKTPKCPDCTHDIRLLHHTYIYSHTTHSQYVMGHCNKCKTLCITLRNILAQHTHLTRKNFNQEMTKILKEEGYSSDER